MGPESPLAPQSLSVPSEADGMRIDRALTHMLDGVSRARIQELIRDGGVLVDGAKIERLSHPVVAGQVLELREVLRSRERSGGSDEGFEVVFEDEALAVIHKPRGMVAHPSDIVRGGTVSERAVERWGDLPAAQGEDRPGIVHRLDADTSGLMVVALQDAAAEELVRMFREREVEKEYQAVVFAETRFDSDWIEVSIGRRPDRPDRMSVTKDGREAETFYETLERFRDFSYVLARPRTGRTHQIRVHLTHIGHPLVGDRVYRGRTSFKIPSDAPKISRHLLHASSLGFKHPISGEKLSFQVDPPKDMQDVLSWLRETRALQ